MRVQGETGASINRTKWGGMGGVKNEHGSSEGAAFKDICEVA